MEWNCIETGKSHQCSTFLLNLFWYVTVTYQPVGTGTCVFDELVGLKSIKTLTSDQSLIFTFTWCCPSWRLENKRQLSIDLENLEKIGLIPMLKTIREILITL